MVGNYAVLAERICSLTSLSSLREGFNVNNLQFTRHLLWLIGVAYFEKLPSFFR
jgi:hypothetical protein